MQGPAGHREGQSNKLRTYSTLQPEVDGSYGRDVAHDAGHTERPGQTIPETVTLLGESSRNALP